MSKYDYLIVGSGLFGAVFARQMHDAGKRVLVIDRRSHAGGNIYCEEKEGIQIHRYGAHIFHTSDEKVWNYICRFDDFNRYTNCPVANYKGKLYNLPFNMNTFYAMWGVVTPEEARRKIEEQRSAVKGTPSNLEEQAVSLVGTDIYHTLIKGYTEKQWGKDCRELPAFIIRRIPVRYTYDNNYFNDRHQGIPVHGYNYIIEKLLEGIEVRLNMDFEEHRSELEASAEKIVYTGGIDRYFKYCLGPLEYRGLHFETERKEMENFQGVAVMNYTDRETPWTRVIEHKHFQSGGQAATYVTKEYPREWHRGEEAYYPVNDQKNQALYGQYAALAAGDRHILFGGRLGEYRYYNMDQVIADALAKADQEIF
jgi:UDP-galactopyranose mutase